MSDKMPESMNEEAVAEWLDESLECGDLRTSDLHRTARAVLALVSSKVREAARVARQEYAPGADNDAHAIHQTATRVMGSPLPPPDCKTCFGCGYIPGTYERPTCDVCNGTGKEVKRG